MEATLTMKIETIRLLQGLFRSNSYNEVDYKNLSALVNKTVIELKSISITEVKTLLQEVLNKIIAHESNNTIKCETKTQEPETQQFRTNNSNNVLSLAFISYLNKYTAVNYEHLITQKSTLYKSFTNEAKSQLAYSLLQNNQTLVYNLIHQILSASLSIEGSLNGVCIKNPQTILLDSQPGTGKTFLIQAMSITFPWITNIIVYRNNLNDQFKQLKTIHSKTSCKFIMDIYTLHFNEAKNYFNDLPTLEDMMFYIYSLILKIDLGDMKLLILDEYTVVSPWFALLLFIACKINNVNFMMTGDKDQHNTINSTKYHKLNNYSFLSLLVNNRLQLKQQMRIEDIQYYNIVLILKQLISIEDDIEENVANNMNILFQLYQLLKPKFFIAPKYAGVVYLTQFHKNIKKRLLCIQNWMSKNKIEYKEAPFFQTVDHKLVPLLIDTDNLKFLPYLLLGVGLNYYDEEDNLVTLISIEKDCIIVKKANDANEKPYPVYIESQTPSKHYMPNEQFDWVRSYITNEHSAVYQYPLKYDCKTYHSVQGQTLKSEEIEIDMDTTSANSIYVALTRITKAPQLYACRTKNLASLMYTDYKNDDYYYKLPQVESSFYINLVRHAHNPNFRNFQDLIKNKFILVSKDAFESSKNNKYIKTLKGNYGIQQSTKKPTEITPLTSVAMFFDYSLLTLFNRSAKGYNKNKLYEEYLKFVRDKQISVSMQEPSNKKRKYSRHF